MKNGMHKLHDRFGMGRPISQKLAKQPFEWREAELKGFRKAYRQDEFAKKLFRSLRGLDKRLDLTFKEIEEDKRKQSDEARNKFNKINFDDEKKLLLKTRWQHPPIKVQDQAVGTPVGVIVRSVVTAAAILAHYNINKLRD